MHQLRCIGILAVWVFLWIAVTGTAAAAEFPKGNFTLKGPDDATWGLDAFRAGGVCFGKPGNGR